MDEIIKKLLAGGIPDDVIEKLKVGLGNTFETELVTNGFQVAAEKIGVDTSGLPYVDLESLGHAVGETIQKDIEAGKTAAMETIEHIEDTFRPAPGSASEGPRPGFFTRLKDLLTK